MDWHPLIDHMIDVAMTVERPGPVPVAQALQAIARTSSDGQAANVRKTVKVELAGQGF